MECDKDMGLIDCKSQVNIPTDWVKIFKDARKKPTSFHLFESKQNMFKNMIHFFNPLYKAACPVAPRPLREVVLELLFSINSPGMSHRDSCNCEYLNTFFVRNVKSQRNLLILENPLNL